MKKSKKLMYLKRVSRCCSCEYFSYLPEDEGMCVRTLEIYPFSKWRTIFVDPSSLPCPHYVPKGGFLPDYHFWEDIDSFLGDSSLDDYLPF